MVGKRWRCGPTAKHMGARIFWGGFFAPVLLKLTMYLAGQYFAFPLSITSYFGSMPLIYTVIDIQSLISAALILPLFILSNADDYQSTLRPTFLAAGMFTVAGSKISFLYAILVYCAGGDINAIVCAVSV